MKTVNPKRKLFQHGLQQRFQPCFRYLFGGSGHLPLRDFIHRVNVIHAFDSVAISLMHRVHSQISRLALRPGLPTLADAHWRRPRHLILHAPSPIHPPFAEVVDVRRRYGAQYGVLPAPEMLELSFQDALGCRPAQGVVRSIHYPKKLDILPRKSRRKSMPPVNHSFHLPTFHKLRHQARHLRPAQPRHLTQISPQQTLHFPSLPGVSVLSQDSRHPAVNLLPLFAFETNLTNALHERPDLLQAELLSIFHVDDQCPACTNLRFPQPRFRLILC